MNTAWRTFLEQQGAQWQDESLKYFSHEVTDFTDYVQQNTLVPLLNHGIIKVCGTDAVNFMQSQFSNDITTVNASTAQLSGYCNPKGRLLASFTIFQNKDDFFLLLDRALITATMNRLSMFVLRSDVTLTDISDEFTLIGINGSNSNLALESLQLQSSADSYSVQHHDEITVIRMPGDTPRYIIVSPVATSGQYWEKLAAKAEAMPPAFWTLLTIQAGQPEITSNTVDAFVPQMVNLHVTNGVSFKKGCYPGQEIVARTQYLGKLKRRMYRVEFSCEQPIFPGTDVYQSTSDDNQSVGKVLLASFRTENTIEALVVLQIAQAEENAANLHIGDKTGPKLTFLELPYSFQ